MLPWLANIELVDLSNASPTPPELNIETEEEEEQNGSLSPVELDGEGWGSVEATQLVLNNLFYITVKVSHTNSDVFLQYCLRVMTNYEFDQCLTIILFCFTS